MEVDLDFPFDRDKYPNLVRGHEYAVGVVQGKIVACIYIIGACHRYLKEVQPNASTRFYFNPDKAERFLRLVQKFNHVKGHWKTENIVYEPWQCWVWMNIMGFISYSTGYRRFRIAHLEVARGNAKSAMASTAALYFVALDDPKGNEISTAATMKEQARIVFDSAVAMAKKNISFLRSTGVKPRAHDILHPNSNSKIRPLSSQANTLDGLNDVLAVLDELHAMKRATFDVITSGMSKRKDSLILCITTAGFNVESVGYTQSVYAKKVSLGEELDDTMFAAVFTLDKDDDIYDPKNWLKANPNWDVSVDPETFEQKARKTISTPADLAGFKVKHLDMWLSEASAFFNVEKWKDCANPNLDLKDFQNKRCRLALDLASKIDLATWVAVFREKGKYYYFYRAYIPEETVKEVNRDIYNQCREQGWLTVTPGATINHKTIKADILEFKKNHKIIECLYDEWAATELATDLSSQIEMVSIGMNVGNLSEPTKKLDALMRDKNLEHQGSPLFDWCIGNVVAKRDAADNVLPKKTHEKLKIDIAVAAIMATAGWLADDGKTSVYEERGIRTV